MKLFITLCITLCLLGGIIVFHLFNQNEQLSVVQESPQVPRISFIELYKEDLQKDLDCNYPNVSTRNKKLILETIMEEADKYDINPLILYSICYAESSFRPYIEHPQTIIEKDGKKISVRAVGLMGVVWEWWSVQLVENKIAEVHSDLFDPVINIKAGAFVYNELYKKELHKVAKSRDESALLWYFGGPYLDYLHKIDTKISTFVRPKLYRKD